MLHQVGESIAADLDAHMAGPPTKGPLLVPHLDLLAEWGQRSRVVDVVVSVGPGSQAAWGFLTDFPSKGILVSIQANLETTITGAGGASRVGLGFLTPDDFGKTFNLSKNSKIDTVTTGVRVGFNLPFAMGLFALDSAGLLLGTIGGVNEEIRVRMTYFTLDSIPDAP